MRFLVLPTHFPRPESMGQGDMAVWTNWIHEETDEIMKQFEEERDSRSDLDDPFNGTANGVFLPLQDPLSLPPPVQTQKRQENNSNSTEPSPNSWENVRRQSTARRDERTNETVTPTQGESHEFREHSRESLDPMVSIRNLHIQQRQNRRGIQELDQTTSPAPQTPRIQVSQKEDDLITFTPFGEQQVPEVQGAVGNQKKPKDRGALGRKRSLNGPLIRDNLIRTKHRKFHTFHLKNV